MDLYHVMARGFHTPLDAKEIEALFRARHLTVDTPCRHVDRNKWQTIDELFPLLKYEGRTERLTFGDDRPATSGVLPFVVGFAVIALLFLGAGWFLWNSADVKGYITNRSTKPVNPQIIMSVVARFTSTPPRHNPRSFSPPTPRLVTGASSAHANIGRLQAEKLHREQTAREQSDLAERMRRDEAAKLEAARKAAGTDYHIPLDEYYNIPVGGGETRVRVHDNDVTSFDVWINGAWHHEVPKQKGITHSGTDETLIYSNGRASLYYVWEISGILNHCLLRVREN